MMIYCKHCGAYFDEWNGREFSQFCSRLCRDQMMLFTPEPKPAGIPESR
jgi:hypothetical protein